MQIVEVGPRDGLQNEKDTISTLDKIEFIDSLARSGLKRIEITSFVSPRWIASLSDHSEVALGIRKKKGVIYSALVPNIKGYEGAVKTNIDEIAIQISTSNTHNKKNMNANTESVLKTCGDISKRAIIDKIPFRAYVSCAFNCPYEGEISVLKTCDLSLKLIKMGAYEVSIGDTTGTSDPKRTALLINELLKKIKRENIALHMHDTNGNALANIFAAMLLGISTFDSSAGGLGGCPYAPGASGNVATEDLVNMLNEMGIDTGVDLDALCKTSLNMEKTLRKTLPARSLEAHRSQHKEDASCCNCAPKIKQD